MKLLKRLLVRLAALPYPLVLACVAILLALPSLYFGLLADDYSLRAVILEDHPYEEITRNPWKAFTFFDGNTENNQIMIDKGLLPWWTDPTSLTSFMRPLTVLTHMLDYNVWPQSPWLMHAQSILWFALTIWAAAVFYRRMIGARLPAWTAALAALLFTLDDAHAVPAFWLANRNALIAAFFGILALMAHDRLRRDGWRPALLAAPAALLAALLAKESAVCVGAYLLAYAIFLDKGTWRERALSLAPYIAVGVAWYAVYKALGFGVKSSGVYIDPAHDPAQFLRAVVQRAPLLLYGQFAVPSSDLALIISRDVYQVFQVWAALFLLCLAVLFAPLIRNDRLARFWCLGMMLSILPACIPFASDRLLMYVGLGGMGLLAQFLSGMADAAPWTSRSRVWRRGAMLFAYGFLFVHLFVSPLGYLVTVSGGLRATKEIKRLVYSFPNDAKLEEQTVVYANSLSGFANAIQLLMLKEDNRPLPATSIVLAPACVDTTLSRVDARTIVARPEGGYLSPSGHRPRADLPHVSPAYVLRNLELLTRGPGAPFKKGEKIELPQVTVTITELTEDKSRPVEARFEFRVPLEDASLRWLEITKDGFESFIPPAIGASVVVKSALD